MCLAVAGKVLTVQEGDPAFRTGNVDFCGIRKTISLAFTPEVNPEISCWCTWVSQLHG